MKSLIVAIVLAFMALNAGLRAEEGGKAELPASYYADLAAVHQRYGFHAKAETMYLSAADRAATRQEKLRFLMALAGVYKEAGRKPEARKVWRTLAESPEPSTRVQARLRLALSLSADGEIEESLDLLEEVAATSPVTAFRRSAAHHLARLLPRSRRHSERRAKLEAQLKNSPTDRRLLELVLASQKDDPQARVETLARIRQATPQNLEVVRQHSESLIDAGRLREAEASYEKMRRDYPSKNQHACEALARIASLRGDKDRVRELLVASTTRLPQGVRKDLHLARSFLQFELARDAEKTARQALQAAGGEALRTAAAMELGEALVRLDRGAEARDLLAPIAEQDLWRGLKSRASALLNRLDAPQAR